MITFFAAKFEGHPALGCLVAMIGSFSSVLEAGFLRKLAVPGTLVPNYRKIFTEKLNITDTEQQLSIPTGLV